MMNRSADFDRAFEELDKELNEMTGVEFFAMFGLSFDDLPSKNQYSSAALDLDAEYKVSARCRTMDLKCA